jgi:hypothetical protein
VTANYERNGFTVLMIASEAVCYAQNQVAIETSIL